MVFEIQVNSIGKKPNICFYFQVFVRISDFKLHSNFTDFRLKNIADFHSFRCDFKVDLFVDNIVEIKILERNQLCDDILIVQNVVNDLKD